MLFPEQKPAWLNYVANAPQLETIGVRFREGNKRDALEGLEAFWRSAKPQLIKSLDQHDFPIADTQRLIAFDHLDWIRCLGNALTRAGRGNEGRYLMSQLRRLKVCRAKNKCPSPQGSEIVRSARRWGTLAGLRPQCARVGLQSSVCGVTLGLPAFFLSERYLQVGGIADTMARGTARDSKPSRTAEGLPELITRENDLLTLAASGNSRSLSTNIRQHFNIGAESEENHGAFLCQTT